MKSPATYTIWVLLGVFFLVAGLGAVSKWWVGDNNYMPQTLQLVTKLEQPSPYSPPLCLIYQSCLVERSHRRHRR